MHEDSHRWESARPIRTTSTPTSRPPSDLNEALRRRLGALADAYDRVVPRPPVGRVRRPATLDDLATYIALNDADDEWVATVAARFRAADWSGGAVAVDDAGDRGRAAGRRGGIGAAAGPHGRRPDHGGRSADVGLRRRSGLHGHRALPRAGGGPGGARPRRDRRVGAHLQLPLDRGRGRSVAAGRRGRRCGCDDARRRRGGGAAGRASGDLRRRRGRGRLERVTGLHADLRRRRRRVGSCAGSIRTGGRSTVDGRSGRRRVAGPRYGDVRTGRLGRLERIATRAGGGCRSSGPAGPGRRRCGRATGGWCATGTTRAGDLVEVVAPRSGPAALRGRRRPAWWRSIDADGVELVRNAYDLEGRVRVAALAVRSADHVPTTRVAGSRWSRDDEGGPTVTHLHDPAGRLVGVVDDHGARVTKVYDRWGNPAATVGPDRRGRQRSCGTSGAGCCGGRNPTVRSLPSSGTSRTASWPAPMPCGAVVRLSYRADDREPSLVVDAVGAVTRIDVVGGLVVGVTDPDGVVTRFERNGDGLITAVIDGLGARTVFGYDDRRRAGAPGRPGRRDGAVRPGRGRIVSSAGWTPTAPASASSGPTPDGSRHRSPPPGRGRCSSTATHGEVETVEDAGAAVSRMEWDGLGRLVAMTNPAGTTVRHRYDGLGRLVSSTDGCGAELRRTHDAEGRVVALVNGEGGVVRREYDAGGRLVAETDAAGRDRPVRARPVRPARLDHRPVGSDDGAGPRRGRSGRRRDRSRWCDDPVPLDAGRPPAIGHDGRRCSHPVRYDRAGRVVVGAGSGRVAHVRAGRGGPGGRGDDRVGCPDLARARRVRSVSRPAPTRVAT